MGVPILRIVGFPTWESWGKKRHLVVTPMVNHKEYYNGEGSGFLQVWATVSLMNSCLHVTYPCTKIVLSMH